jgi:hypothetical protein
MAGNPNCPVKLEKRQEKNQRLKCSNNSAAATITTTTTTTQ